MTETETPEAPPAPPETNGTAPDDDIRKYRIDRIIDLAGQFAPTAIAAVLQRFGPEAEGIVYGGLHCSECAAARDSLKTAVSTLESHLEQAHDQWPASLESGVQRAHETVARLSHSLRLVDRVAAPLVDETAAGETAPEEAAST